MPCISAEDASAKALRGAPKTESTASGVSSPPTTTTMAPSQDTSGAPKTESTASGVSSPPTTTMAPSQDTSGAPKTESKASGVSSPPKDTNTTERELSEGSAEVSAEWWGNWHHGIPGETCCMCQQNLGHTTLLYSAADYHHMYGSHNAWWQCQHDCPRRCGQDWHHGSFFGCYDEQHLLAMDRQYGRRHGYSLFYGHFGNLC